MYTTSNQFRYLIQYELDRLESIAKQHEIPHPYPMVYRRYTKQKALHRPNRFQRSIMYLFRVLQSFS
ncbi:MAG TPA: hypothetical protein VG621_02800 [Candidatus Paceibacterota bacterium]|nr:hypothetical protein [Candidatus Paceibacterota bacterium]